MPNKPDQTPDSENPGSDNPNLHGPGPVKPQTERYSQAFREDYANNQVIQPGYDAVDTCDNNRYLNKP